MPMTTDWNPKVRPFGTDLTKKILEQGIKGLLVRRYYGKEYEDKLDYHYQTADEIMRLLEKELTP